MTTTETDALVLAALNYAEIGWPVVPLHTPVDGVCDCPKRARCESPGKHPRTLHGLDDASCDEATIRRWWTMFPRANIGIDLARAGLVDIAPDSLEWFAEFTARGLPSTPRFASGGGEGHAHHLYRRPEHCEVYRDCHTGEYDVLSAGYAVMPPSLHQSGRLYTWLEPASGILLETARKMAPEWGVAMLARHRRPIAAPQADDEDAPPVVLSLEGMERWSGRVYDRRLNGHVDRSHSLWSLAVRLLEAGCRPSFVEELLAERDVALGWEKFSKRGDAAERYRIITAAAVAGQGPGRIRLKPKAPAQPVATRYGWMTAQEIREVEEEDIAWYATGFVGNGLITLLDGKAKLAGKTTLLLALVHAVLHGEEFLGQRTTYSPVVYLTEQSGPSFRRNLSRAGLLDRADLHVLMWSRIENPEWPAIVAEACVQARGWGAGVMIIDTLPQFASLRGEDENRSGAILEMMKPLQAAIGGGLAVLASRHDRKSGGEVGDSGRGSGAGTGIADIILHVQRLPGNEVGKERQRLMDTVSRLEETPERMLIELEPGTAETPNVFRLVGDARRVQHEEMRIEILAALPTADHREDAPEFEELRKDLGIRALELRRELNGLIVQGLAAYFGRPRRYYQPARDDD
jgi:hypothetical protein